MLQLEGGEEPALLEALGTGTRSGLVAAGAGVGTPMPGMDGSGRPGIDGNGSSWGDATTSPTWRSASRETRDEEKADFISSTSSNGSSKVRLVVCGVYNQV